MFTRIDFQIESNKNDWCIFLGHPFNDVDNDDCMTWWRMSRGRSNGYDGDRR